MHVRLVAVAAAIALGACAKGVSAPPASSLTSTRRAGQFVWHDLVTRDLAQSKAFYGKLLGWSFEDAPGSRGRYVFIRHDGRLIGGMAEVKDGINVSQWVSHVSATDVDRAAASATAAGGRVAVKPFSVGGTARIAVLQDPQGAPFGVVKLEPGDPARADASVNGWLWHELWTSDTSAARQFYGSVLGYRTEALAATGQAYAAFKAGGDLSAGLQALPVAGVKPNWLPYIRVASARTMASRVAELGGKVLVAPADHIRSGTVALVQDPSGAAVALQEWNPKGGN